MSKIILVNTSELNDHPDNPRQVYRQNVIDSIANDLKRKGAFPQEHALKIYKPNGHYTIIAGHHRKRAAQLAGIDQVWAWLDEEISEDEAYMQLATSNEQDAMTGIERAVHVFNWCVPGQAGRGKSGQERSITDYAERVGIERQNASMLRRAGEFESSTGKSATCVADFQPTYRLWSELASAPSETWQTLRDAAESRQWTVSEASKVVKQLKELCGAVPEWFTADLSELAQILIDKPTEAIAITQGFKEINRLMDTLGEVTIYLTEGVTPTEKTTINGREMWVIEPQEHTFNQKEAFKNNLGDEYPTSETVKTAYDAVLSYSQDHKDYVVRNEPVLTDEEYVAQERQRKEQARMKLIQFYTPLCLFGESLDHLRKLTAGSVKFISLDPPYNVNKAEWDNKGTGEEYQAWLKPYLTECHRVLSDEGTLVVFGVPQKLRYPQAILEDDLEMRFQNWIAWHVPQGGNNGLVLMRRHEDILVYSKTDKPYFNADAVTVDRDPKDVRKYGGVTYDTKNIGDVWVIPPVDSASEERTEHPTQKPVALMERLVSIFCPPNGIVLDCFGGSGTTSVAAINLGRQSIYMEREGTYIQIAQGRFQKALAGEC